MGRKPINPISSKSKYWTKLNTIYNLSDIQQLVSERHPEIPLCAKEIYNEFIKQCKIEALAGNDVYIPYVGTLKIREHTLKQGRNALSKKGLFLGKGGKINGGQYFLTIKENMRRLGYIYRIRIEGDYQRGDMKFKAGGSFRSVFHKILTDTDQPYIHHGD